MREPGSPTQEQMLRYLVARGHTQVAAHGRAPWLSASRALVRRGLANSWRTGWYAPTEEGKQWVKDNPSSQHKETFVASEGVR